MLETIPGHISFSKYQVPMSLVFSQIWRFFSLKNVLKKCIEQKRSNQRIPDVTILIPRAENEIIGSSSTVT